MNCVFFRNNCTDPAGWNLRGSDWGCCGNYDGCCTYASFLCYIHDALCRCCDVGDKNFCGPKCKPEADCLAPSTTPICKPENDCLSTSSAESCEGVNCETTSGGNDSTLFEIDNNFYNKNISQQTSNIKSNKTLNGHNTRTSNKKHTEGTNDNMNDEYQSDYVNEGSGETEYSGHI